MHTKLFCFEERERTTGSKRFKESRVPRMWKGIHNTWNTTSGVYTASTIRASFPITVVSAEKDSQGKGTMMNICANMKDEVMLVNTVRGCFRVLQVCGIICLNVQGSSDSLAIYVTSSTTFIINMSNIWKRTVTSRIRTKEFNLEREQGIVILHLHLAHACLFVCFLACFNACISWLLLIRK